MKEKPEVGREILAAAKILVEEVEQLNPEQAQQNLDGLDSWIGEYCGPQGFTWREYQEYKVALEKLASGNF
jgi:hypothetical protein